MTNLSDHPKRARPSGLLLSTTRDPIPRCLLVSLLAIGLFGCPDEEARPDTAPAHSVSRALENASAASSPSSVSETLPDPARQAGSTDGVDDALGLCHGWRGARWGMNLEDARAALGGATERVPGTLSYRDRLAGRDVELLLELMGRDSLERIVVTVAEPSTQSAQAIFQQARAELADQLGPPSSARPRRSTRLPEQSSGVSWTCDDSLIDLLCRGHT